KLNHVSLSSFVLGILLMMAFAFANYNILRPPEPQAKSTTGSGKVITGPFPQDMLSTTATSAAGTTGVDNGNRQATSTATTTDTAKSAAAATTSANTGATGPRH